MHKGRFSLTSLPGRPSSTYSEIFSHTSFRVPAALSLKLTPMARVSGSRWTHELNLFWDIQMVGRARNNPRCGKLPLLEVSFPTRQPVIPAFILLPKAKQVFIIVSIVDSRPTPSRCTTSLCESWILLTISVNIG